MRKFDVRSHVTQDLQRRQLADLKYPSCRFNEYGNNTNGSNSNSNYNNNMKIVSLF